MKKMAVLLLCFLWIVNAGFCFALPVCAKSEGDFSVVFIDCGQGDAALIACDGEYMLIDGGDRDQSQKMYTILKDRGITELKYVIASHTHSDHIGGLPGALNFAVAKQIFCSRMESDAAAFGYLSEHAANNGDRILVPSPGSEYPLGSAVVRFLGGGSGSNENDSSLVVKVIYGNTGFLFMGDAGSAAERALLRSGEDLSADMLKVGHHGADEATSAEFLAAVRPDYGIISVGAGNSFCHPTEDTLRHLYEARALICRTDLHGDITAISDGEKLTILTEKDTNLAALFTSGAYIAPAPTEQPSQPEQQPTPETGVAGEIAYVGNIKNRVFHYAACKGVDQMKESNKYYFTGNREYLISQGYKPCSNCCP